MQAEGSLSIRKSSPNESISHTHTHINDLPTADKIMWFSESLKQYHLNKIPEALMKIRVFWDMTPDLFSSSYHFIC